MNKPEQSGLERSKTRWQWSIRTLLLLTLFVAVCTWAGSIDFGLGIFAGIVTCPALLLCALNRYRAVHSERLKLWAVACIILGGATVPPLFLAAVTLKFTFDAISRMAAASFGGLIITAIYGVYLLLMASVLEAAFGVKSGKD